MSERVLLQLENCQVTANVKTVKPDQSEYHAVQVAASDRPSKTATAQMKGHFRRAKVHPKRIVKEFPVTPDAHVPIGEDIRVHGYRSFMNLTDIQELHSPLSILFPANMWTSLLNREPRQTVTCLTPADNCSGLVRVSRVV